MTTQTLVNLTDRQFDILYTACVLTALAVGTLTGFDHTVGILLVLFLASILLGRSALTNGGSE